MTKPDVSFDMAHVISAGDAYDLGFDQGQKAVMHQIEGILFSSLSDHEAVMEIERFANEFWGDDAE
jgi:hypothetical protein